MNSSLKRKGMALVSFTGGAVLIGALYICLPSATAQAGSRLGPRLPSGHPGDNTADAVLGQVNFFDTARNFVDGAGLNTSTGNQFGAVAIDTSVTPNRVYVADSPHHRVLGFANISAFTTHSAADIIIGQPDAFTTVCNGNGLNASSLCNPTGVAVDEATGNLYVADQSNHRVLFYVSPFTTDTVADDVFGQFGAFNTNFCDNNGLSSDSLCNPTGVAVDSHGNLWVADNSNSRALEYFSPEVVTATAGSGDTSADLVLGAPNFTVDGCTGVTATSMCNPEGVAVDTAGHVYLADTGNNRALEYTCPTTNGAAANLVFGQLNVFTTAICNNAGISARSLCAPVGVATDLAGNLWISDRHNHRILGYNTPATTGKTGASRVSGQNGIFASNSCNNNFGVPTAPITARNMCNPAGIAVDAGSPVTNLIAIDASNNRALQWKNPLTYSLAAAGVVGQAVMTTNFADFVDGRGFDFASNTGSIAIDTGHTPNRVYVSDLANNRVLGWGDIAAFTTHLPANRVLGQTTFFTNACNQGLTAPTAKTLCGPRGLVVDSAGNLYVSDTNNNRVLEYNTPFTTDTTADVVFGQFGNFTSNGCNQGGLSANSLCTPVGLALDNSGVTATANLWVGDFGNHRVLEYNTPLTTDTTADFVIGQAGSFASNTCNLGGLGAATLCHPHGVGVDSSNNVYVADLANNRVLEYNTPLTTDARADAVYGQLGSFITNTCDKGGVSATSLCDPRWVEPDGAGHVYIADTVTNRVLRYKGASTTATLVFGQGSQFTQSGCKSPSANALCTPNGIAFDTATNLYVVDAAYFRVLQFLAR